jgi:hypothetical protein
MREPPNTFLNYTREERASGFGFSAGKIKTFNTEGTEVHRVTLILEPKAKVSC